MASSLAQSRALSRRNPLGRYSPKRINPDSRWRFIRDRRAALLQRIGGGAPDERQALAHRHDRGCGMEFDRRLARRRGRRRRSDPDRSDAPRRRRAKASALVEPRTRLGDAYSPGTSASRPDGSPARPSCIATRGARVTAPAYRERTPLARFAARPGASERPPAIALQCSLSRSLAVLR